MSPGDAIVSSDKLYGGSITQLGKTIKKFGWSCVFVDVDDHDAVRAAMQGPNVKGLWAESLANPGGVVTDIKAMADIAHEVRPPPTPPHPSY